MVLMSLMLPSTQESPPPFSLDVDDDGSRTLVRCRGELDLATAPVLEAAVFDLLSGGPVAVVIDVRDLDFVDCAGIHGLERAAALVAGAGRPVEVLCDSGPVPALLALTETTARF
jgi:anti-sigma B factor antagonist